MWCLWGRLSPINAKFFWCQITSTSQYRSGWNLWLRNHLYCITKESSRTRKPKTSTSFVSHSEAKNQHKFCVPSNDTMNHNKFATLHLVWAVASEQIKSKLSYVFLVSLKDVISDAINCEIESFHEFCEAHHFGTFFLNLSNYRLLLWLQWWLVTIEAICDIFSLFPTHSVIFLDAHALTFFWTINLITFLAQLSIVKKSGIA